MLGLCTFYTLLGQYSQTHIINVLLMCHYRDSIVTDIQSDQGLTNVEKVRAVLTCHPEAKVSPESSIFFMDLDLKREMQITELVMPKELCRQCSSGAAANDSISRINHDEVVLGSDEFHVVLLSNNNL